MQLKVASRATLRKGAVHSYGVHTVSPPDYVVYTFLTAFTQAMRMSVGTNQSTDVETVHTTTPRSLCGTIISSAEECRCHSAAPYSNDG